jgi:hypothetical protein
MHISRENCHMSYTRLAPRVIFSPRIGGSMWASSPGVPGFAPFVTCFSGSAIVLVYKILGLQPGPVDGLVFNSCVTDLQSHPDLWLDECPFLCGQSPAPSIQGLRVELVSAPEGAQPAAASWPLAA